MYLHCLNYEYAWFNNYLTCYHPPPPPEKPRDNSSPSGPGWGIISSGPVPVVGGVVGQIKSNFSLILRSTCYFSRRVIMFCGVIVCINDGG